MVAKRGVPFRPSGNRAIFAAEITTLRRYQAQGLNPNSSDYGTRV